MVEYTMSKERFRVFIDVNRFGKTNPIVVFIRGSLETVQKRLKSTQKCTKTYKNLQKFT